MPRPTDCREPFQPLRSWNEKTWQIAAFAERGCFAQTAAMFSLDASGIKSSGDAPFDCAYQIERRTELSLRSGR